jgi:hypothetical protein
MQYFVSAENSSYFYWQLELLIESFLMQGLEKDLVIGLAQNDDQKIRGYSSNLVKHGTKFMVPNEGRESDYLPLNRINSIRYALAQGVLEFPFVMIHSDMILKKPLELPDEEGSCGLITNNFDEPDPAESLAVEKKMDEFVKKIADERSVEPENITRVPFFSAPIVFTKFMGYCSEVFFSKVHLYERSLLKDEGSKFPCERTAWEMSIAEAFQHFNVKGQFMSAPLMFSGEDFNFIHYKSGIPPAFHKKYFKFESGTYYSSAGPYETLMDHNPTTNTNYLQQVIRSYNKRNAR